MRRPGRQLRLSRTMVTSVWVRAIQCCKRLTLDVAAACRRVSPAAERHARQGRGAQPGSAPAAACAARGKARKFQRRFRKMHADTRRWTCGRPALPRPPSKAEPGEPYGSRPSSPIRVHVRSILSLPPTAPSRGRGPCQYEQPPCPAEQTAHHFPPPVCPHPETGRTRRSGVRPIPPRPNAQARPHASVPASPPPMAACQRAGRTPCT